MNSAHKSGTAGAEPNGDTGLGRRLAVFSAGFERRNHSRVGNHDSRWDLASRQKIYVTGRGSRHPIGGQMSPETIFNLHLVLGYVAWLLCFRAYLLPRLK